MRIVAQHCSASDVVGMRELYQHECRCQVIAYSMLPRGLADSWSIVVGGTMVGYAGIWNKHYPGRVSEFYVIPAYRSLQDELFQAFLLTATPIEIGAQTNIPHMATLLYDYCDSISQKNVHFQYDNHPGLALSGATLQICDDSANEWLLQREEQIMAKGGILHHYNAPYSDLYMEVFPQFRRLGAGSYLVQELAARCWQLGRIPCARCNVDNSASRRTLRRAGLRCCGYNLAGKIAYERLTPLVQSPE